MVTLHIKELQTRKPPDARSVEHEEKLALKLRAKHVPVVRVILTFKSGTHLLSMRRS